MTIDVRPLLEGDIDADDAFALILKVDLSAFDETAPAEAMDNIRARLELDRSLIAWDGTEAVGCSSVFSFVLSVPGGSLPVGGVTWVGVKPSHRRQGAMRGLLDLTHTTMYQAGREPVAALWASQPGIYGRFGYGLASQCLSVVVQRAQGSLSRAPHDPTLRLRMIEPALDRADTQAVYDTVRALRPGMPTLTADWHTGTVLDPKDERDGAGPLWTVVVESAEGVRGYARYAFKHDWSSGYADGTVMVRQIMATDPAAEAALWRFLIDFDLSGRVDAWNLPSDCPLPWWLDEPRHNKRQPHDQLYVRLIDVASALSGRGYASPVDVVVQLDDVHCPWNAGRWRLSADPDGATCTKTSDEPDLTMDVAMLGAAYLGGTTLDSLGAAGWVEERTPGALQVTSTAFSHRRAPWSPFVF